MTTLKNVITKTVEYVDTSIPTKLSELTNDIGFINEVTTEQITTALGYTPVQASDISSVYRYKGTKTNYSNLPSSGNTIGDVWNVTNANGNIPAGTNYSWTGSDWDALGGSVDLSNYALSSAIPTKTSDLTNDSGFLTSHQSLSGYVPTSRTINSKALSSNISLTASDVGAIENSAVTKNTNAVISYASTLIESTRFNAMVDVGGTTTGINLRASDGTAASNNLREAKITVLDTTRGISLSYLENANAGSEIIIDNDYGITQDIFDTNGDTLAGISISNSGLIPKVTLAAGNTVLEVNTANGVTAPTPATDDNSTRVATTAFVNTKVGSYLPLAGGTMSGQIKTSYTDALVKTNDTGHLTIVGGSDYSKGASLLLRGKDEEAGNGWFQLRALSSAGDQSLIGKPDGTLTWRGARVAYGSAGDANTPVYVSGYGIVTSTGKSFADYLPLAGGTTTGKVLLTGGTNGIDVTDQTKDADTLFLTSVGQQYYYSSTNGGANNVTNIPGSAASFSLLSETIRYLSATDLYVKQTFMNLNGTYIRRKSGSGAWTPWKRVLIAVPEGVGDANTPVYVSSAGEVFSTGKSFANYLPLAGGTMTGNLTLDISDTTATTSTPRDIPLYVKSNSQGSTFTFSNPMFFEIPTNQSTNYGSGFGFGNGGLTVITGGECGRAVINAESYVGGDERIVLGSDNEVDIWTNGNTLSNRIKTVIGNGTIKIANKPVINWLNANTTKYISKDGAGTYDGSSADNAMSLDDMRWYLQTLQLGGGTSDYNSSYTLTLAFAPLSSDATYGNISFDQNKMPGVQNIIITTSGSVPASGSYSGKAPRFTSFNVAGSGLVMTLRNIWVNNEICVQRGATVTCDTYLNIGRFRCTNYGRLTIGNGTYDIHRYNTDYLFTADTGSRMYLSTATMTFNFLEQCNYSSSIWRSDTNSCVDFRYDRMKWTGTVPAVIIASTGTLTATSSTAAGTAAKVATLASGQSFTLATNAVAYVTFTTENTASNPTLNINSTGAKAIWYNGSAVLPGMLRANFQYAMKYDGTRYIINNTIRRCETITSFARAYRGGSMSTTYNSGSWNFSGWGTNIGTNADNNGVIGNRVQTVVTNPTSQTEYRIPFCGTSASNATQMYINDGFVAWTLEGTTSAVGTNYLRLGNNVAKGTAKNKKGILRIHSETANYTDIVANTTQTANYTLTLPAKTGTIAVAADHITKSGDRGTLSGYETVGSATTINDGAADANSVNANVTVSNGTANKAWTKIVYFQSAKTVTLGSNWKWVNNEAPTIVAGGILVCTWCGAKGIASFLSPS